MLVLYQSSRGYTSKYERKIPGPQPSMTALLVTFERTRTYMVYVLKTLHYIFEDTEWCLQHGVGVAGFREVDIIVFILSTSLM